jgi:endoglycosylceramidase
MVLHVQDGGYGHGTCTYHDRNTYILSILYHQKSEEEALIQTRTIVPLLLLTLTFGVIIAPVESVYGETDRFLSVQGTWIVDSNQRPTLLRGVNYPGYENSNPYGRPKLHSEANYAQFARIGFNVVRLPISWARLEPRPGVFDSSYLDCYVDRDVKWAERYGLYIVLDMHQYDWAYRFGGCGAPDWAVKQYPQTEAGKQQAVSDFWNNTVLQEHLCRVWVEIARYYANETTIAGYDILNEPWVHTSVMPHLDATHVDAFYLRVVESIRTVDPNHIIFLEPANMNTFKFPLKENIVWSPHFYPLAFQSNYRPEEVQRLEADLAAKYQKFVVEMKVPMWIGEFGAFMKSEGCRTRWLEDSIRIFEKYQVGWAWWAFPENGRRLIPNCLFLG